MISVMIFLYPIIVILILNYVTIILLNISPIHKYSLLNKLNKRIYEEIIISLLKKYIYVLMFYKSNLVMSDTYTYNIGMKNLCNYKTINNLVYDEIKVYMYNIIYFIYFFFFAAYLLKHFITSQRKHRYMN